MTLLLPLLIAGLLAPGAEPLPPPRSSIVLRLPQAPPPAGAVELRLQSVAPLYPVAAGHEAPVRIEGSLVEPPTDPGRTLIRFVLEAPLYDKRRRALLPAGTRLTGLVHLLRGEYRFVAFQSLTLPDGRSLAAPDEAFRLGPGSELTLHPGGRATLTVVRPLRMEAFAMP